MSDFLCLMSDVRMYDLFTYDEAQLDMEFSKSLQKE